MPKLARASARLLRWLLKTSAAVLAFHAGAQAVEQQEGWRPVPIPTAESMPESEDPYFVVLSGSALAGQWVRTSATLESGSDLRPLVHGFRAGKLISRATLLPCSMTSERGPQHCSALSWIPPAADEVRVRWWNRSASQVRLRDIRVEVWQGGPRDEARAMLLDLLRRVRAIYAWTTDVDWSVIERTLMPMAAAPAADGGSPLPQMAAALVLLLPRHEHMAVQRVEAAAEPSPAPGRRTGSDPSAASLPTCQQRGRQLTLRLPATPDPPDLAATYIKTAHDCLRRSATAIELDLRESSGGDAQLMIAAAAPLLRPGLQLSYVNSNGKSFDVQLGAGHVSLANQVQYRFAPVSATLGKKQVTVLVGPGCASACEALAIALAGQAKLKGEPTAGLTTANESLPLGPNFNLIVTSGWMRDRKGRVFDGPVHPGTTGIGARAR